MQPMSIASSLGARSLVQLGVSLSDIALIFDQGRKIGNWLAARRNDEDLLESLGEDHEVLFPNSSIINLATMESRYPDETFIYHGERKSTAGKNIKSSDRRNLRPFSWIMVVIITFLDVCSLPEARIIGMIIDVFISVLDKGEDEEEAAGSLRVALEVNIKSWRSVGQVRELLARDIHHEFHKVLFKETHSEAVPELNPMETWEMARFLEALLSKKGVDFQCFSAVTYAAARAIQRSGVYINATRPRVSEGEFVVTYMPGLMTSSTAIPQKYLTRQSQIVSFPAGSPKTMIESLRTHINTHNRMDEFWDRGSRAASKLHLIAKANLPHSQESEFHYELEGQESEYSRFDGLVMILSGKAFPCYSQDIMDGVNELTMSENKETKAWLESYAGVEHLARNESGLENIPKENVHLWLSYQALVFGFYYELLGRLVNIESLSKGTHLQGVWGHQSTTFLEMCTHFGQTLRSQQKISRSHVLYMLATMFAGRQKTFTAQSRTNLLGILGPISIVALPLYRATDAPQELAKYVILDLPIVQLVPEGEGELYASNGFGISMTPTEKDVTAIRPRGTNKKWSVHPSMGKVFRDGGPGVVMVARCEGRLVGWFDPTAADTLFLSSAYQAQPDVEFDPDEDDTFHGFDITDEDWQRGSVSRPSENNSFGIIHSVGSPVLRYAAAGFYGASGEEVAIATNSISMAFGRIEGQESGVVIA